MNSIGSSAGDTSSAGSTPAATGKGNNSSPSKLAASAGPTNFSGSTTDQIVRVTQSGTGAGINATASGNAVVGTSTTGAAYGVYGLALGVGGFGVLGNATATTGYAVGVKGGSASTLGTGVRGINTAATGATTGISAYVASPAGIAGVFNNAAGGKILSGQKNGVEKFSVDGSGNVNSASGTYQIGGSSVLNIGSSADENLFLGVGAGDNNVAGQGQYNAFSGYEAGLNNTTGSSNTFAGFGAGYQNTIGAQNAFFGTEAGYSNTAGTYNTFSGFQAGRGNTTGSYNTFSGYQAGLNNTTGSDNTFSGLGAGYSNTTGYSNTFSGLEAGYNNTTGSDNTFSGLRAGSNNTTAGANTFSGYQAGFNNTIGSYDVYIASQGPSSGTESDAIRIGDPCCQFAAYIAGIYGVNVGGVPVQINANGQLGAQTSSLRFKEQILDMGDSSSRLFQLRPVTFFYKPRFDDGSHTLQYGLIAEEVPRSIPTWWPTTKTASRTR